MLNYVAYAPRSLVVPVVFIIGLMFGVVAIKLSDNYGHKWFFVSSAFVLIVVVAFILAYLHVVYFPNW